jgi:hypothetical protein
MFGADIPKGAFAAAMLRHGSFRGPCRKELKFLMFVSEAWEIGRFPQQKCCGICCGVDGVARFLAR